MLTLEDLKPRLSKIRLVVTDVDGVLTNGNLYYVNTGEAMKVFNVKDGLGIKQLLKKIHVAIVSGNSSKITEKRAQELGVTHVFLGISNKAKVLESLQQSLCISKNETLSIGDDLNDLTLLELSNIYFCPIDAHSSIKRIAHHIVPITGGKGVFRYVSDAIIESQDEGWEDLSQPFLDKNT
jgi:3-deoxy-D-manno-octulosonate 8-phosphate phosphatase (KDO 8-P phosphatase)